MVSENIKNCHTCEFLKKKPGLGNYFIYNCTKWGIVSKRTIPYGTVIDALNADCPYYTKRNSLQKTKPSESIEGLDLIV